MKTIDFTFTNEINDYSKKTVTNVRKTASLRLDDNTEFSSIIEFLDDVKKIWKMCVKPYGTASEFRSLEVCEAVYDREEDDRLHTVSFDRWHTRYGEGDFVTDKDEPGVYLVPDEKYTESGRDMFISKNIFQDIAYTLR